MQHLPRPAPRPPRIALLEIAPVALLLMLCAALTAGAGPAMEYMQAAAQALHTPVDYLNGVLSVPSTLPGGGG